MTYDELNTAITEVEAILNSRPLTYLSATDLEEPLTPSHMIYGRRLLSLPDYLCHTEESDQDYLPTCNSRNVLSKRVTYIQTVLNQFWNHWKRDYLVELRENQRYRGSRVSSPVTLGDIVLIHDETPRGMWRLGIIEELIQGKDNETRGAVVRIKAGQGASAFLRRPIQKLYPLEVRHEEFDTSEEVNVMDNRTIEEEIPNTEVSQHVEESNENTVESQVNRTTENSRPRRRAAFQARDNIFARLLS